MNKDKFHETLAAARAGTGGDKKGFDFYIEKQDNVIDLLYPALFIIKALVKQLSKQTNVSEDQTWQALVDAVDKSNGSVTS